MASRAQIPLPQLDWENPNKQKAFNEWKDFMDSYIVINKIKKEEEWNFILLSSGSKGRDLLIASNITAEEKKTPENVWTIFKNHMIEKPNKWVQRIELQSFSQAEHETVEEFVLRLKTKADKCSFNTNDTKEERITEQIIKGCKYQEKKKKLLGKSDLTMAQAIEIVKNYEATIKSLLEYKSASNETSIVHNDMIKFRPKQNDCNKCGINHKYGQCPAYGTVCNKCKKPNHWAKMCRSSSTNLQQVKIKQTQNAHEKQNGGASFKPSRRTNNGRNKVHDFQEQSSNEEETDEEHFTVNSVSSGPEDTRQELFAHIVTKAPEREKTKIKLKVKVDTGANANILTLRSFKQIYPDKVSRDKTILNSTFVKASNARLVGYSGDVIQHKGTITLHCGNKNTPQKFFIVDTDGPNILGLQACRTLNLIKVNCNIDCKTPIKSIKDLKAAYPEQFDKIGSFEGEFHIQVSKGTTPIIQPPRKYPVNIRDEIKEELNRMEDLKVITRESEPTDWVNSIAFSRKSNGKLRICLDPKDLNKGIRRTHHKIPTLEEISHKFHGARFFSKLDAQHGYWAIHLDKDSSKLTTFNTPFGRYRFLRLPFGLNVSQDVFQHRMDQILEQCPGTLGISDEVCVFGKTEEEHDRNLINLLEVSAKKGLVFNSGKCFIKEPQINFYGLIWDSNGAHPDPQKCDNIKNKPAPTSIKELQQFLGIIQYMSPFIPKLSSHTDPLRKLLQKDSAWQWTETHESAFQNIKNAVHEKMTLSYYDPNKTTILEVDSSQTGIGVALLQEGKPIAFASKSLTDTESRYANIERELLAVVFALERFHTYIYGKAVIVQSDHKPLENIQFKNLSKAPPRLQRMLLRIQPYSCTIQYKAGKDMIFADYLSRISPTPSKEIELDHMICQVSISEEKFKTLQEETAKDAELSCLASQIIRGWPEKTKDVPHAIKKYWSMRDFLSIEDGLVVKNTAVVIPESMKKLILTRLHEGHQGIEKCLLKARDNVFWTNMTKDITDTVKKCDVCERFNTKSQQKQPLMQHDVPTQPFQKIAADIFHMDGRDFLLVADYYSKMPFVKSLKTLTSKETIDYVESVFAIHGIPQVIITDNAKQFKSYEFEQFKKQWDFKHVTSSPHYPQSNGFIERMVQTVKNCLKKAKSSKENPQLALLSLRTTPIDNVLPSPAELLFNRKVQSKIPHVVRHTIQSENTKQHLQNRQAVQKVYFDKHAKELPPLIENQQVSVRNFSTGLWSPATIVKESSEPRSYIIEMPDGTMLRRNRIHLKDSYRPQPADPPLQHEDADTVNAAPGVTTDDMPVDNDYPPHRHNDRDDRRAAPHTRTRTFTRSGRAVKIPQRYE